MSKTDVTIVGVGNIGVALVNAWLKAGLTVTMWNRNPDRPKLKDLVSAGASLEKNLPTAILQSDIVVLCVSTYDNIKEILTPAFPLSGLSPSASVINITTGTSQQARDMEAWLKSNGLAHYFDGAIMVTPELVGTEHSSMFFSGENEAEFANVTRILEPLGRSRYVAQDAGAASLWDVAALAAMDGMFVGAIMAMNLLKRQRPDRGSDKAPSTETPMREIVIPLMTVFLPHIVDIARSLDAEAWGENFGNPASMHIKGLETIMQCLREEKVSTEGLNLYHQLMKRTIQDKGEDAGQAAMGTYLLED